MGLTAYFLSITKSWARGGKLRKEELGTLHTPILEPKEGEIEKLANVLQLGEHKDHVWEGSPQESS